MDVTEDFLAESRPWSAECREMAKELSELASPDSEKIFHIIGEN